MDIQEFQPNEVFVSANKMSNFPDHVEFWNLSMDIRRCNAKKSAQVLLSPVANEKLKIQADCSTPALFMAACHVQPPYGMRQPYAHSTLGEFVAANRVAMLPFLDGLPEVMKGYVQEVINTVTVQNS